MSTRNTNALSIYLETNRAFILPQRRRDTMTARKRDLRRVLLLLLLRRVVVRRAEVRAEAGR